ncbi:MAG: hypothetical protein JXQ96_11475 [Cyclobacteriaceae bacterium]
MMNSKDRHEYTFKVVDTTSQYNEEAASEREARNHLATELLQKEGFSPKDGEFSRHVKHYAQNKLKLMFMR